VISKDRSCSETSMPPKESSDCFEAMLPTLSESRLCRQLSSTHLNCTRISCINDFRIFRFFSSTISSNMAGGALSGIWSYSLIYPLDLTKTMMSINKTPAHLSVFKSMQFLYEKYGLASLYKGLGATYFVY